MHNDQAAGLRAMHGSQSMSPKGSGASKAIRVIAVASGKGGVGKTNVSVNLGVALSKLGNRVLLMDADMGLANVDIMLGLQTDYNLSHVLSGEKTLQEVIVEGPAGLRIIPAASGVRKMAQLSLMENAGIVHAFSELSADLDVLIVDTAAGIAESVVNFCRAAQEVVVVVTDEPASITDAYALIKVLSRDYQVTRFRILANMSITALQGKQLYDKLARVAEQFLDVQVDFLGAVPQDNALREAVQKQIPVTIHRPHSAAATAFFDIADKINAWPIPEKVTGHLQFFVENLFQKEA
ncbi:MinD/ParA family protein [Thiomicrorhabdus sp.]|uniref:MinD/ParA family protein n=1 Tax=Thiomicrorhabdus sp. TaxID=2039724 RepID=UPI0029C8783F|nr:MinD/ParA family protein [Thiomicrorhabdus sp.]